MRKTMLSLMILCGCSLLLSCGTEKPQENEKQEAPSAPAESRLVDDPVAAIRDALPTGWAVDKVDTDAFPFNREPGSGTAVYLTETGREYGKQQFSAVVFGMCPSSRGI
jgi:hypothetical protein